jgi:hypothetical protein
MILSPKFKGNKELHLFLKNETWFSFYSFNEPPLPPSKYKLLRGTLAHAHLLLPDLVNMRNLTLYLSCETRMQINWLL